MLRARVPLILLPLLGAPQDVETLSQRLADDPWDRASWRRLAEHHEAGAAMARARLVLRESPGVPEGWLALGRLADRLGDYAVGVAAGRRAVELLLSARDLAGAGEAEFRLAHRHHLFGAALAERSALLRARGHLRSAGRDSGRIEERLRSLELEVSERAAADPGALEEAVAAARRAEDPQQEHRALHDLALYHYKAGDFEAGLGCYREILLLGARFPLTRVQRGRDLNGSARLALEQGLSGRAPDAGKLLEEALGWAEEALSIHLEEPGVGLENLVRDRCVLAHLCDALGREGEAIVHYREERRLVEEQRTGILLDGDEALRLFHGKGHHIFEDIALFLARGGPGRAPDLDEALRASETGRAGALRELLRLRGLPSPSWLDQDVSLEALRRRAEAAGTAILVYLVGSHRAGIVSLTGGGTRFHPLGPLAELDAAGLAAARAAFDRSGTRRDRDRTGREALEALLGPARAAWSDARRIVLVGAARWGRVPFGALVLGGDGPLEGRYLAARHEVALAPTLGVLAIGDAPLATGPPLALGSAGAGPYDPELSAHFGAEGLPVLGRAEEEARSFASRLRGSAVVGRDATEAAWRAAAGASILHFAGHALVDDEDGSRSALLLVPEPGRADGFLTLGEILETRLGARLVVLSGCRTARGERFTGEGIGGMARCLLAAGARSLLVTLAPLDDEMAPLFLRHLAHGLAEKEPAPSALARAQRRMLAARFTAHPASWAVFSLYGQEELLR